MKAKFMRTAAIAALFVTIVACGKKKDQNGKLDTPKIGYAIYQIGLHDTVDSKAASEWLNRAEMFTVLQKVDIPDPKNPKKVKEWLKIERTTGKQGFVDAGMVEPKAFVVVRPMEVLNVNQAAGKKLGTVPPGQVGFVVEEKADWGKVRFGYRIYEQWAFTADSSKWVDLRWAQLDGVSYDPTTISHGVDLETALRKFYDKSETKKAQGKKELEAIIADAKSPFIEAAQKALASQKEPEVKPEEKKSDEPAAAPAKPATPAVNESGAQ
jgi:lipoprotein LenA